MKITNPEFQKHIRHLPGIDLRVSIDISNLSTMRLKSIGNIAYVENDVALGALLRILREENINYKIIGWGANQILPEDAGQYLYIKIQPPANPQQHLDGLKNTYILPASLGLNNLVTHALRHGLMGWEVLTGIPASVGGAAYMNAGTKFGDFSQIIKCVSVMNVYGEIRTEQIKSSSYSYRKNSFVAPNEVITQVEVMHHGIDEIKIPSLIRDYLDYRKKTQPLKSNNCGCVFKNPPGKSAGQIIDQLGLKGLSVGDMRVSTLHGNFLENTGSATASDFWNLVKEIQDVVKSKTGENFELEIMH